MLGGASNALIDILKALDRKRFRPFVLCISDGLAADRIRDLGIKVYTEKFGCLPNFAHQQMTISWDSLIRILKFLVFFPIGNFTILKILVSERINVVYINSLVSISCGFIPWLLNVPSVIHFREFPIMNRFGLFQHWLAKKIASKIVCASYAIRHQISTVIPDNLVIYDWVDTEEFYLKNIRKDLKKKWRISEELICIGMVGALCQSKGIFLLYEAANILLARERDCSFIYVGGFNKPLDRKLLLCKIHQSGHYKSFILTGWTADVAAALATMDIVVCPNIKAEGFGKTIIEAGAMEKPVVASNIPPTDELVVNDETGLLVEANNVDKLVKAIEFLIDNPSERERLGKNARKWVMTHFPEKKSINAIIETLDNVSNKVGVTNP